MSGEWVSTRGLVISILPVVVSFIWLLRCHSRCHPAWHQVVVSAAGEVCGVSMRCGHFSVVESHMVCVNVCSPRASDVLGQAAENRDGRERLVCVLAWSGAKSLANRAGVACPGMLLTQPHVPLRQ